jgi:magnesium transporter
MSLEKIQELLNKHKLVEGMVHSQHTPRQEIVETLVHRQHLAEIESLLKKLPVVEIAAILETLTIDDAKLLWRKTPEERKNEILWELPDTDGRL